MSGRKALCSVLASLFVLAGLPACVGSDPGDYVYYRVTQAARVSAFAVPDYDVSQTELDAHPGAVPFNIHLAVDPTVDTEGMVGGEPILASFGFRSSGAQYTHQVVGLSVDNPGDLSSAGGDGGATDGYGGYAAWIELPEDETASTEGDRTSFRHFPLDRAASEGLTDNLGSANSLDGFLRNLQADGDVPIVDCSGGDAFSSEEGHGGVVMIDPSDDSSDSDDGDIVVSGRIFTSGGDSVSPEEGHGGVIPIDPSGDSSDSDGDVTIAGSVVDARGGDAYSGDLPSDMTDWGGDGGIIIFGPSSQEHDGEPVITGISSPELSGGDGFAARIPMWANEGLVTWDPDPDAGTDLFYLPLVMISTLGVQPDGFPEMLPPEQMTLVTPPSADPDDVIGDFQDLIMEANIGPQVVMEANSGSDEDWYRFQLEHPYQVEISVYDLDDTLYAPVYPFGPSEPAGDALPRMYSGFPDIPLATADEEQLGETVTSATVFVANGYRDLRIDNALPLIIHNIPVPGELLFIPDEPHIVELPYTFWVTIEPLDLPPQEAGPTDSIGESDLLRVIVSPALGGSVTVSTPEGTQQPSSPAEGDWQGSLAFDYVLDAGDPATEVTLTAEPAEGYRFVAWQTDDSHAEIHSPDSPTTALTIHPVVSEEWGPKQTTVTAYFAAYIGEPPEDTFPDSMMGATIKPVSHTIEDESGCESTVEIGYDAIDLTGGQQPINYTRLDINTEELTSWSGTPTDRYHNDVTIESDCSEVLTVTLTGTNSEGHTMVATKVAPIPPLSTHFEYHFEDGPEGGDCKKQIVIDLQAVDLTVPDNPITHVVVKGNTSTWHDSGAISTDSYAHSFSGLVTCGGTYAVEVKATDADGNTHTYRETIEIPEGGPPEEEQDYGPPPPATTTLYGAMAASAHCTSSGPECSCQLSVSVDGKDLTGGSYPVTSVVLRVNGQVWHDSGSISTTQYHQTVTKTVSCGAAFSLEVTVENSIGQTGSSTGSLTTPVP